MCVYMCVGVCVYAYECVSTGDIHNAGRLRDKFQSPVDKQYIQIMNVLGCGEQLGGHRGVRLHRYYT